MASLLRMFIGQQRRACLLVDRLLPDAFTLDGNRDFIHSFVPRFIRPKSLIYDIGSGKTPLFAASEKAERDLTVVGLDVDASELARAPHGAYDWTICSDICDYQGDEDADIVICQAVLEHVRDVRAAFCSLKTIVRPGGVILIFAPSRRAIFAQLNRILPQAAKRRMLFAIWPEKADKQGFPVYYDRCTPSEFRRIASETGLIVRSEQYYFTSSYFSFFIPLYLLWRAWLIISYSILRGDAAETFVMALQKPPIADTRRE